MSNEWFNQDGLYIRYGQKEVEPQKSGFFATPEDGGSHVVSTQITLTDLTATAAIQDEGVYIPKGYTLARVEVISDVAATSAGAATLNVGFKRNSDRSTEIDHDGAIAALALASINAVGKTTVLTQGSTGAGALVGTIVSGDHVGITVANYGTAAYTAGVLTIRFVLRKL